MVEEYPDILTVKEVMEVLGISRNTAYYLIQSGEMPAFKIGKKLWRIRKKDLADYLRIAQEE